MARRRSWMSRAEQVRRPGRLLLVVVGAELERVLDLGALLLAGAEALGDEFLLDLGVARRDADRLLAGHLDVGAARAAGALSNAGELAGLEIGERSGGGEREDEAGEEDFAHADAHR